MTGFKRRQGSQGNRPESDKRQVSFLKRGGLAAQRYLLISTAISSTALGLALIVSFLAATQGSSNSRHTAVAANVEVSQIEGRHRATALESTLQVIPPELAPSTAVFPVAAPAPPLNVEDRDPDLPRLYFAPPDPVDTLPLPPAAQLDALSKPEPLDRFAAALPVPLLAQTPEVVEVLPQSPIAPPGGVPSEGEIFRVDVTFYDCLGQGFCGAMYNGQRVYEGAAACSWDLPLGTRFAIEGDPTRRIYVCADRGLLPDTWVDIYFYSPQDGWDWQRYVGRQATLHILSVPFDPPS